MIDTLNRLLKHREDTQDFIKQLKKQKYLEELSTLTDRPTISLNSKRISAHSNSPLYTRYNQELRAKESRLVQLIQKKSNQEDEWFSKTCTFFPSSLENLKRTPEELIESCLKWKDKKKKTLQIHQENRIKQEMNQMRSRPDISENSKKLSEKRSLTPVLSRLTQPKPAVTLTPVKSSMLRSNISENSKKILAKKKSEEKSKLKQSKLSNVKTPAKVSSFSSNRCKRSKSTFEKPLQDPLNESFLKFHQLSDFSKSFKINSSRSPVNQVDVNLINFEKLREIISPNKSKD